LESAVLGVRDAHVAWGGRKIRAVLRRRAESGELRDGAGSLVSASAVPSASTVTAILRRHGRLESKACEERERWQRFEHAAPNELWQMDFKGHFALGRGGRCHPLTVLDDHSRFALGVRACVDETALTVERELTGIFRRYGLPKRMLMDNGSPWGDEWEQPWTKLTAWLLRLDIGVTHCRPRHPQTQGKDERFNRTLKVEVIRDHLFDDAASAQAKFDPWREVYNCERPHEALGMAVPASRYQVSVRPMPAALPALEYGSDLEVIRVCDAGRAQFRKRQVRIGKAFIGDRVGVRATTVDGVFEVYYGRQWIGELDMRVEEGGLPRCRIPSAPVAALPARTESGNAEGL
jgi:transposase InsO family protein